MRTNAIWFAPGAASIVATIFLSFIWRHQLSSLSVDVGWHYLLVDYYSSWPRSSNNFSAIHPNMAGYPPISHFVGAGISFLSDSPFTGMRFAAVLFVCVTYSLIFEGARNRNVLTTSLCFCIIVACLHFIRHDRLAYGGEILGNYFYAQACGQAATLATIFALSRTKRLWFEAILVPALIFTFGWLYALAQLQILGGMLVLWCCAIWRRWLTSGRPPFKMFLYMCILLLLGAAAIRFHPTYDLMRTIANNEGGDTQHVLGLSALAGLACVLAGLSIALVFAAAKHKIELVHPLFLAAAGGGSAIAFAVHYSAFLIFHAGSAYGIRKHTFSLVSLVLVICIVLLAQMIADRLPLKRRSGGSGFSVAAVSIATMASVWLLLDWGMIDLRRFEEFQREVRLEVARFPDLSGRTVSRISGLSVAQNFTLTLVDLKVQDALAIEHNLANARSSDAIQFEIVDKGPIFDRNCVAREFPTSILLRTNCKR